MTRWFRLLLAVLIGGLSLTAAACTAQVGIGVGVAYPGPWAGGWHGGVFVGGPIP
jgi:hypothetical protein